MKTTLYFCSLIILLYVLKATAFYIKSNSRSPSWISLDCEQGHDYLFSEDQRSWQDARVECDLYGGYLLEISGIKENNCLLKYAHSANLQQWWLTGGNDRVDEGVFVHAHGNKQLEWLSPCWTLDNGNTNRHGRGSDILLFATHQDFRAGCWVDFRLDKEWHYICERN